MRRICLYKVWDWEWAVNGRLNKKAFMTSVLKNKFKDEKLTKALRGSTLIPRVRKHERDTLFLRRKGSGATY